MVIGGFLARRRSDLGVGVVERVSSGLLCTQLGLLPIGREMLEAAERVTE